MIGLVLVLLFVLWMLWRENAPERRSRRNWRNTLAMLRQNDQALATAAPNSEHGHGAEAGCQQRLVRPPSLRSDN